MGCLGAFFLSEDACYRLQGSLASRLFPHVWEKALHCMHKSLANLQPIKTWHGGGADEIFICGLVAIFYVFKSCKLVLKIQPQDTNRFAYIFCCTMKTIMHVFSSSHALSWWNFTKIPLLSPLAKALYCIYYINFSIRKEWCHTNTQGTPLTSFTWAHDFLQHPQGLSWLEYLPMHWIHLPPQGLITKSRHIQDIRTMRFF